MVRSSLSFDVNGGIEHPYLNMKPLLLAHAPDILISTEVSQFISIQMTATDTKSEFFLIMSAIETFLFRKFLTIFHTVSRTTHSLAIYYKFQTLHSWNHMYGSVVTEIKICDHIGMHYMATC